MQDCSIALPINTQIAGIPMTDDALQLIFGWGDLRALGRSAQVCRFFRKNVNAMLRRLHAFKINVAILKSMPIFSSIDNMFENQDVPQVMRKRHDLICQLQTEEKVLLKKGVDSSTKRIMLRDFATRYAALGNINYALQLLIEVDLCSLQLVADEKDAFTKADRLLRVVNIMSQVVKVVKEFQYVILPQTLQRLNECVTQMLMLIEPLKQCKFGQYQGFIDVMKQSLGGESEYALICKYAENPIVATDNTPAMAAAIAPSTELTGTTINLNVGNRL